MINNKISYKINLIFLLSVLVLFGSINHGCRKDLNLNKISQPKDSAIFQSRVYINLESNGYIGLVVNGHKLYNTTNLNLNHFGIDSLLLNSDTCRITVLSLGYDVYNNLIPMTVLASKRIDQVSKNGHWNIIISQNEFNNLYTFNAFSADPPPPANGNFKIKIVNFYKGLPGNKTIFAMYPDGTMLNTTPLNIPFGTASDYIELPAGTYQLFILDENKKIIDNFLTWAPLSDSSQYVPYRPYIAGGIYEIFVSSNIGYSNAINSGPSNIFLENKFKSTITTGKLQLFNGCPGITLNYSLGQYSGKLINLGDTSKTGLLLSSSQNNVNITSSNGNLLEKPLIIPSDNKTQYIYLSSNDNNSINLFTENNDFSYCRDFLYDGLIFNNNFDIGSTFNGPGSEIELKFYNLSPDAGSVTFMGTDYYGNTDKIYSQVLDFQNHLTDTIFSSNLTYAETFNSSENYISYGPNLQNEAGIPTSIKVYQTLSDGSLGKQIGNLELNYPFVQNKNKYILSKKNIPVAEPGLYSIILVGKINKDPTSNEAARLIVLKHSK